MVDRNSKGEVRLRFANEFPWNEQKEEDLQRNVEWMTFECKNECSNLLQDMKALAFHHHALVDREVLLEMAIGNREAIWKAVDQIHHRSLMKSNSIRDNVVQQAPPKDIPKSNRTYAEVTNTPSGIRILDSKIFDARVHKAKERMVIGDTIFITKIDEALSVEHIWRFLKKTWQNC